MSLLDNNGGMYMPVAPAGNGGFGGGFGGDGGWWAILFLFALMGNGGWGFGGGGNNSVLPYMLNQQTQNDVARGFDNVALSNQIAALSTAVAAGSTDSMNRDFALQQQFCNCCCENRLAIANLSSDIAREACADRQAVSDGVQRILDQMCQDKIDSKNDEIAQLRQELLYARGQASQVTQNSNIINGIYDRLSQCPVGTVPVYGEQPIFTCNNNGCGCGNF